MTETASQLLNAFDSLPVEEQHQLLAAMLRRAGELPNTFLAEDDLVSLADNLFQALDQEEANGNKSDAQ